jgi:hypothetical protein
MVFNRNVGFLTNVWFRWTVAGVFGVILLSSQARSSDVPHSLVGEWRESDGTGIITVLEDGKVLLHVKGICVKGTYTFLDNHRIRLETIFGTMVYAMDISDTTLHLVDENNETRVYEKKPPDPAVVSSKKARPH